jgi:hypothetical protein
VTLAFCSCRCSIYEAINSQEKRIYKKVPGNSRVLF